ncbi:sulfatase-like hydrolase/transferase [Rapidithrix thailandica]|uniref:Sulfatase-like hydrolase/transferase n=1 Tax=Rapidithrix thailandica TaxID=413964 RepID=A0AAW9S8X3_9BACT
MTFEDCKRFVFGLLVLLTIHNTYGQDLPPEKPNIILIMADDLGYETLGCNGGDSYPTPRLDQLSEEGMLFENCFSTPLCTPSRVQLMTGKYNFRNYIGFGLLDPSEKTFGHFLQEAGYTTCIAGKWQLYGNARQQKLAGGRTGTLPQDAGFDQYCLWQVKELGSRYKNPTVEMNGIGTRTFDKGYGPDIFVEYIETFIETHQNQPFFVYFPMCLTHDPFVPTPASSEFENFDSKSKTNDPKYFGEMVGYMDNVVGRLVDKVNALGLRENTLILFIGDNGTDRKITSVMKGREIKGDKGHTTMAGTHVPFIASWKGKVKAGTHNKNLIDFTDFLPSLLDITGQTTQKKSERTDGLSFYPQLLGKKTKAREWVFCHYDPRWGKFEPQRYVQNTQWKLYETGAIFNLQKDPEEKFPLQEKDLPRKTKSLIRQFYQVLENLQ